MTGRVVRLLYLGAHLEVTVELADGQRVLALLPAPGHHPPAMVL